MCRSVALAVLLPVLLACGGSERDGDPAGDASGTPSAVVQPTFESLRANVFTQSCSGCHNPFSYPTPTGAAGNLDFTAPPDELYEALVSDGSSNDAYDLGSAAFPERVVPGDPEASLLYQKLARDEPGDHGSHMPPSRVGAFDAAALAALRAWIENGAPRE
jgi:hypothetical protein